MVWLWRALKAIGAGTFVALVLALLCALFSPVELADWGSRTNKSPWLAFSRERGFGREIYVISASPAVWPAEPDWAEMQPAMLPSWVDPGPDFSPDAYLACVGAGWPATAFTARFENSTAFSAGATAAPAPGGHWESALVLSRAGSAALADDRVLPLRILALGLATNIAFWTGAIVLFLLGAQVLKRAIRRSRGRCPRCGYDLRAQPEADPGCPECGWRRAEAYAATFAHS